MAADAAYARRFLIVGGGKMGEALMKGWITSTVAPAEAISLNDIEVVNPGSERRDYLERTYGVSCVASTSDVSRPADVVVLAVKPQVMGDVLDEISSNGVLSGDALPLFVSIAAGCTTESLEAGLPRGATVVRVMPNMPLSIAAGATGVCAGSLATDAQVGFVAGLFDCLGKAVVVPERDIDAVCAVSGSGPAYVVAMVEALRDAGAAEGLAPELAETLALQTVLGTALLVDETGSSLAETRESICSPGGTTLAALDAMREAGFGEVFAAGVRAAVARSKELAQCT